MKRKRISQSIYRILLSEVLPFELPLFLNNEGFYKMADRVRLFWDGNRLKYKRQILNSSTKEWADAWINLLNGTGSEKKSFNYFINKGDNKGRELVFIHPYMQLKMMKFYQTYDSLILNFCSQSSFSLRYPDKRACYVRPKLRTPSNIDYKANEYPKHYFHYHKYNNINAFYQGKEFLRLESRFSKFFKTDITKCFDKIPIDRLAEVLYQIKTEIKNKENFAWRFTSLMHEFCRGKKTYDSLDDNKADLCSDAVIIGPEFSRLFAEMFLQGLDRQIERLMSEGDVYYKRHYDYECYRYVDDIFFFYNSDDVYTKFKVVLEKVLSAYDMQINESKSKKGEEALKKHAGYAKRDIILVVEKIFTDRLNTIKGYINRQNGIFDVPFFMQSQYCILDIKRVISENGVKMVDISSSMLARIHRKLCKALDKFDDLLKVYYKAVEDKTIDNKGLKILHRYEGEIVIFFTELTKVLFFVFSKDMRMNTSIRVLGILSVMIEFLHGMLFINKEDEDGFNMMIKLRSSSSNNKLFKTIIDELNFLLKYNSLSRLNGLEISNLLLILTLIPRQYSVNHIVLENFLSKKLDRYQQNGDVNVLTALTLLFVLCKNGSNNKLKHRICRWLLQDAEAHMWSLDDAESFLIITSLYILPDIEKKFKIEIYHHVEEKFRTALERLSKGQSPFMQWHRFNLIKACLFKYSAEVY